MLTVLEILKAARAKIATPETWCRGTFAKNRHGHPVNCTSSSACRFCAIGAIYSLTQPADNVRDALERLRVTCLSKYGCFAGLVNDKKGHKAILKVFDETIKQLEVEVSEQKSSEGRLP